MVDGFLVLEIPPCDKIVEYTNYVVIVVIAKYIDEIVSLFDTTLVKLVAR